MDARTELTQLLQKMKVDGVKLVYKDESKFWRFLGWLVMVVTLGRNKDFMDRYVTTIGKTIALSRSFNSMSMESKLELLVHELVHVKQFKRYTTLFFGLGYLLLPLPIGLAYVRYVSERNAYLAGFKKLLEYIPDYDRNILIDHAVTALTGPNYAWTWPFPKSVRAWFERNL